VEAKSASQLGEPDWPQRKLDIHFSHLSSPQAGQVGPAEEPMTSSSNSRPQLKHLNS
jgi:hypothetical protein